ncbi:DNA-binding protein [Ralstonia solanacearum]|uniref:DNA-binding protein n=1 Tax=Ralstonia solanacearum TaxID=305 RepID=UPI00168B2411|nr:DNA-binding protein [Ralstonia solanacearum]MDB0511350.1 DNA-binding protein [Ralstonia solanacearum]QNT25297.1 DNA-binding protein [Ralstonia solanacearum]QNT62941.1 DNA-binding protein [Ralstonia solanacearum]
MRQPQLIEHALRRALSGPKRHEVTEAVGWDKSAVSRFLDGSQGVTIDKIDHLVRAVGYILVTSKYLDAVATLGEVGMSCECARQGLGECGRPQP